MTPSNPTELVNDPANPLRPVDWRWLRAVDLVERGEPASSPYDDDGLRLAMRFVRALRDCRDDAGRQRLALSMPAQFQAHAVYAASPSMAKSVLEARLLTDESFAQVAGKCETTAEVVAAYEQLFFCVRDRLCGGGYILGAVMGGNVLDGSAATDLGEVLKARAYAGGATVLDELLDALREPPMSPERPERCRPAEREAIGQKLLLRASIALDLLPIDNSTPKKLAVLCDAVSVFRRGAVDGGGRGLGTTLLAAAGSGRRLLPPAGLVRGWSAPEPEDPAVNGQPPSHAGSRDPVGLERVASLGRSAGQVAAVA
jgi:hypothetical protein